jgi:hypothetical protein
MNSRTNDIDQLRRIELKTILALAGGRRDRYDKNKWHTSQGIISVSGEKFFNWHQSKGGGGAIDLVIHLKKCDFKTAIDWLAEQSGATSSFVPTQCGCRPTLQLPKRDDSKLATVRSYLLMVRQIDAWIVKLLVEQGTLYADTRANAVFLLLGKENQVVGAELRGTSSVKWRAMATGSRKDLGYFSTPCAKTKTAVLCESAIDAISYLALNPDCRAISTSGANPNPAWLPSLINDGYRVFCGFDADGAGDKMAERLIQLYPIVKRLRPAKHDWNEFLISKRIS